MLFFSYFTSPLQHTINLQLNFNFKLLFSLRTAVLKNIQFFVLGRKLSVVVHGLRK